MKDYHLQNWYQTLMKDCKLKRDPQQPTDSRPFRSLGSSACNGPSDIEFAAVPACEVGGVL